VRGNRCGPDRSRQGRDAWWTSTAAASARAAGASAPTAGGCLPKALANANATIACLEMAPSGVDLIVKGCNLHVQSGGGATRAEVTGWANRIIANNDTFPGTNVRPGSHNLVIGQNHPYTSFGGLLAGTSNSVTGPAGSVTGGSENTSGGIQTSVSGGT